MLRSVKAVPWVYDQLSNQHVGTRYARVPPPRPPPPASDFGSPLEVEKNGMLRASFGEDGKLDELEMMFDGVAVHQQLQRAMGGKDRAPAERGEVCSAIPPCAGGGTYV